MYKVFLSSTARDLSAYRKAVADAINRLDDFHCVRMEDFGARNAQADDFCRAKIAECAVAVFLAGLCYGSSPEGSDESYTVREYLTAKDAEVPRLVFLSAEGNFYPDYYRESDEQWARQQDFRVLLNQGHIWDTFTTPEELAAKVAPALSNWVRDHPENPHPSSNLLKAEVRGAGAVAQGNNVVATGAGSVAARTVAVGKNIYGDVININVNAARTDPEELLRKITQRKPEVELSRATADYLDFLVNRYRFLDFRGMGIADRVPLQLPLLEMYVPLEARVGTPEGETWARELRLAGRAVSKEEARAIGRYVSERQPVLQLLKTYDGLIVLGDPGAGKTTFLKFLALSLATGQGPALGLGERLPVLVPLSAYATALGGRKTNLPLDRFISRYHQDRGVKFSLDDLLKQALAKGGALFLLDGLDEVKEPGQRRRVVDLVTDFFSVHRKAGNKFVLTSRIVGYPEVRPQVEGLAECTLVDLEDEQIEDFVGKWTAALERAALGQTRVAVFEAEREREELLSAIHRSPGVRALAVNPLLLTILALMKRQGITLPERRVELYQKYVETLLKHWNLARSLAGRVGRDLDVVETLRILAPLTLWMHRTSPGVGLVPKGKLQCELKAIYQARGHRDAEKSAQEFLDDVREHASLLLDRGGNQFGFIHLTFQEYLAAVALAQKGQQAIAPIVDELAAHLGDDTWHEVSLLAIGYLGIVQQRDEAASAVLDTLMAQAPGEPGAAVILAGEAIADVGSSGVTPAVRQRVVEALLQTLCDEGRVAPVWRVTAGRVLASCGDPRPEVMTLDGMVFCRVPAGPFLMGSADDPDAYEDEKPLGKYNIPYDYWIARYPITVAQFRAYVEAGGTTPRNLDALRGPDNHPVVWASWHEALAFCRWLTQRWREQGWLPEEWSVKLPSEPEWEKAVRGGLQIPVQPMVGRFELARGKVPLCENPKPARRYPWGDESGTNRANYHDTKIGETSTVGCFPGGVSPYGCEEIAGNVWEWTRSLYWGRALRLPRRRPRSRLPLQPPRFSGGGVPIGFL